jgi:hypothetical protein
MMQECINWAKSHNIEKLELDGASTLAGLRKSLRRVMGSQTYIVQERINLLQYEGNILDVRVMTQKDNKGSFLVTGKACRIGRPGSITSNISAGGQGQKVEFILSHHFSQSEQRERIINEVNMVALEAAKSLDKSVGSIGELGIDIGIDQNAQVWFIEANLKPARKVFYLVHDYQGRRDSVERPLLYSRYLAEF